MIPCFSPETEKQEDREDLSHPVHADNCLLVSELNECFKEPPAYTHRDFRYPQGYFSAGVSQHHPLFTLWYSCAVILCFSAILYLNEDFEGGDFIFTELDGKTVTVSNFQTPRLSVHRKLEKHMSSCARVLWWLECQMSQTSAFQKALFLK